LKLARPIGVAQYGEKLFVSEWESSQIAVVDRLSAEVIGHIGIRGRGEGELLNPTGIHVNHDLLFVCDGLNHRISVFSAIDHKFLYHIGDKKLRFPSGVYVSGDYVFVVCQGDSSVHIFEKQGQFIRKFKAKGTGAGQIAVANDEIYLAEQDKGRIRVFDMNGKEVRILGAGDLKEPVGVIVRGDTVYVADQLNDRIMAFNRLIAGEPAIGRWECSQGSLPTGITLDEQNNFLFIANYSEQADAVSLLAL